MTVYEKIDKVLREHENYKYASRSLDSVADYIDWAHKWHKITEEQTTEVCDRICALYDRELSLMKGNRDNGRR